MSAHWFEPNRSHQKRKSGFFPVSVPFPFPKLRNYNYKCTRTNEFCVSSIIMIVGCTVTGAGKMAKKHNNVEIIVMTCEIHNKYFASTQKCAFFFFHSFTHTPLWIYYVCLHFPFNQMKWKEKKNFCAIIIGTWQVINKMHYSYSLLSFDAKRTQYTYRQHHFHEL